MGSQFSEEFLLGYRAGHRDGFADAVILMRDAATGHQQGLAMERREKQLTHLLSGGGLVPAARSSTRDGTRAATLHVSAHSVAG